MPRFETRGSEYEEESKELKMLNQVKKWIYLMP